MSAHPNRDPWEAFWGKMEEDRNSHQALVEEMRAEWECLRKDDTPSLVRLLRTKESLISAIQANRESMVQTLSDLFGEGEKRGRTLSDFVSQIPPDKAQKMKNHLRGIDRLRRQMVSLNDRNKRFIEETLTYLQGVFSLFASPYREETRYAQQGKVLAATAHSCWMSREV